MTFESFDRPMALFRELSAVKFDQPANEHKNWNSYTDII